MFDDCIIMAGGSGTRLWPASSSRLPKQFLPGPGGQSFFRSAVERGLAVSGRLIIIAGKGHVPHVLDACAPLSAAEKARIVLIPEPLARNTAPAIACGTVFAERTVPGSSRNMLVLTSDHVIGPLEVFRADAEKAAVFSAGTAANPALVVFGIPPGRPDTGYGYIETAPGRMPDGSLTSGSLGVCRALAHSNPKNVLNARFLPNKLRKEPINRDFCVSFDAKIHKSDRLLGDGVYRAASFREKPDRETAEKFLKAGNFYWNSGMFAFASSFMLDEFRRSEMESLSPFEKLAAPGEGAYALYQGLRVLENWPGLEAAYQAAKAVSIDYAVAEKCRSVVMIRSNFDWFDVGSWDEYARLQTASAKLRASSDKEQPTADVFGTGAAGACFVDADIPVALCGVEDLIVVIRSGKDGGPAAALIAKKGETQKVKDIVEQIKAAGRTELL